MAVIAILELAFKPHLLDEARVIVRDILADTRAFEGCLGVDVLIDAADETRWLAFERWSPRSGTRPTVPGAPPRKGRSPRSARCSRARRR